MRRTLGATYRAQLRPGFGFPEVAEIVGYLAELGVEVLYVSPVAEARPGSLHGYDVTDPTEVRAELGGRAGFDVLTGELGRHGLGLLLDIVPNHLSTWPDGRWWGDVLRRGRDSPYAEVFDVDWDVGGAHGRGKVALPVLERPLDDALAAGDLELHDTAVGTRLSCGYVALPVSGPYTEADDVAEALAAQHYRLVPWRDAAARNYRRYLDIDDLVGTRVDDEAVFHRMHALVAELAVAGVLAGVRVDRVDGLADPQQYLERLATLLGDVPVVVEKILTGDEQLPVGWLAAGTTGYEVIDDLSGALVSPSGLDRLVRAGVAGGERGVATEVRAGKQEAMEGPFRADVARAAALLGASPAEVRATVLALPVGRTYPHDPVSDELLARAAPERVAEGLREAGGTDGGSRLPDARRRLEQLCSAVAAKGIEDTAWYRVPAPLAFCELGGDPGRARPDGPARLVARAAARARDGRAGLVPGSTHDARRSADVRSRLLALAELPEAFEAGLVRLRRLLPVATLPDGSLVPGALEQRFLAETMLAVLPPAADGWDDLPARVQVAVGKSAREAKLRTSWREPDALYESALAQAVSAALADRAALLRRAFGDLVDEVARLGAVLSLGQVALRAVLPGYPDCYQGDESWAFNLVEPDNRRPVDFDAAARRLASLTVARTGDEPASLRRSWRDGRVKLLVTRQSLRARQAAPAAFDPRTPVAPVEVTGSSAGHAVVLARASGGGAAFALALATKEPRQLPAGRDDLPVGRTAWTDTAVVLPPGTPRVLLDAFTGRRHDVAPADAGDDPRGVLWLADVLRDLPVALLVGTA